MSRKKKLVDKKTVEAKARKLEVAKVITAPAQDVYPNTWNPNRQTDYQFRMLCLSVAQEGYNQFALVRDRPPADEAGVESPGWAEGQLEIIDGEHRWTAFVVVSYLLAGAKRVEDYDEDQLRELRDKRTELIGAQAGLELPLSWADKSTAEAMVGTLRHNRATGEENVELSAAMLRDFQELGVLDEAMADLQLTDVEVNRMLNDIPVSEALAGMEFGDAWAPTKGETIAIENDLVSDKDRGVGTTDAANTNLRNMEAKIAQAKTDDDRKKARNESKIYRLVLAFEADEGDIVRKVLGPRPAVKLLEMCRLETPAEVKG